MVTHNRILIIGGTGFIGQALMNHFQAQGKDCYSMSTSWEKIPRDDSAKYYHIGDVGSLADVQRVVARTYPQIIINAAAIKDLTTCEREFESSSKVNTLGHVNVLAVAAEHNINTLFISSDKACEPSSIYGTQKLLAEKATTSMTLIRSSSCHVAVRYGNVWASTGSIGEYWPKIFAQAAEESNPVNLSLRGDPTRFFWLKEEVVDFVEHIVENLSYYDRTVVVPSLESCGIYDIIMALTKKYNVNVDIETSPMLAGEKQHEAMIGGSELAYVSELNPHVSIISSGVREGHTIILTKSTSDHMRNAKLAHKLVNND